MREKLKELERLVVTRCPLLAKKLKPGLPEAKVIKVLEVNGISGDVGCLVDVYTWRNGTILDLELKKSGLGFFPSEVYELIDLERAINNVEFFKEAAENFPKLSVLVGRYVPVFWGGGVRYIAVDITPESGNSVVLIDANTDHDEYPLREGYSSFEEFIDDLIWANQKGVPPRLFIAEV